MSFSFFSPYYLSFLVQLILRSPSTVGLPSESPMGVAEEEGTRNAVKR